MSAPPPSPTPGMTGALGAVVESARQTLCMLRYRRTLLTPSEIGCYLSHLRAVRAAFDDGRWSELSGKDRIRHFSLKATKKLVVIK